MKLKKTLDSITLKGNPGMAFYWILLSAFSVLVLWLSRELFLESDILFVVIGFVAVILFAYIFVIGIVSFYIYTARIKVDENGVTRWSLLGKKFISWQDIKDYGITEEGRIGIMSRRRTHPVFYLYFSKNELYSKDCEKKLYNGYYIRIRLVGRDLIHILEEVIPFCEKNAKVERFGVNSYDD